MTVAQHLTLADYIITLDEKGTIAKQGGWKDSRDKKGRVSKAALKGEDTEHDRAKARDGIQAPLEQVDFNIQDSTRKDGDMALYRMLPVTNKRNTS